MFLRVSCSGFNEGKKQQKWWEVDALSVRCFFHVFSWCFRCFQDLSVEIWTQYSLIFVWKSLEKVINHPYNAFWKLRFGPTRLPLDLLGWCPASWLMLAELLLATVAPESATSYPKSSPKTSWCFRSSPSSFSGSAKGGRGTCLFCSVDPGTPPIITHHNSTSLSTKSTAKAWPSEHPNPPGGLEKKEKKKTRLLAKASLGHKPAAFQSEGDPIQKAPQTSWAQNSGFLRFICKSIQTV